MAAECTSGRGGARGGKGAVIAAGLAELSQCAASLAWRDVPEHVRRRGARIFADDLAIIVAARAEPELGAFAERIVRASGPAEATLLDGSGRRLDRYSAALREKVAITPFEPELYPPHDRPARVTWELEGGSLVARECLSARGGPDRPFTEAEIRSKIRGILHEPYPALSGAMMEIMDLAPNVLARPWRETVKADGEPALVGVATCPMPS